MSKHNVLRVSCITMAMVLALMLVSRINDLTPDWITRTLGIILIINLMFLAYIFVKSGHCNILKD